MDNVNVFVRADIEALSHKLCGWDLDDIARVITVLGTWGVRYDGTTYTKKDLSGEFVLDDTGMYFEVVINI